MAPKQKAAYKGRSLSKDLAPVTKRLKRFGGKAGKSLGKRARRFDRKFGKNAVYNSKPVNYLMH